MTRDRQTFNNRSDYNERIIQMETWQRLQGRNRLHMNPLVWRFFEIPWPADHRRTARVKIRPLAETGQRNRAERVQTLNHGWKLNRNRSLRSLCRRAQQKRLKNQLNVLWIERNWAGAHGPFFTPWQHTIQTPHLHHSNRTWPSSLTSSQSFSHVKNVQKTWDQDWKQIGRTLVPGTIFHSGCVVFTMASTFG